MDLTVFLFIGTPELIVVLLVVVMLFGSKKIPELARGLGKGMREFKNATSDIQEEIRKSSQEIERNINQKPQAKSKPENKTNS
ncbi:MAG: twin-arginine translocase TatA/TatE family subunit [Bacteroidetes bacterium]|nr:MAG: twin-arginine translocase TatA/TatE family subunit [Bacteroidota bacterium]MBL1145646.1 twin-arginine translocase TatA/TatE family subunit [Bacteroidota bacterium]MCB0802272.1 twin-arginine translocase TatA/TatE family subunit [Flavobacteriales bacterium]NOG58440.1 twin-arginine translocase TatA/TatE family subunit [Bacteroidota bacterium]